MDPRCFHCGESAEMCANTCRDGEWEREKEETYSSFLLDRGFFDTIKDWFSVRREWKKRNKAIKNDTLEIPF